MKIKKIETKEEWIKALLDGAKGVSNCTPKGSYLYWNGKTFMYDHEQEAVIVHHTSKFGIIEEPQEIEVFEYIYKGNGEWYIEETLMTEDEAKEMFNNNYMKTGRSFKVPKD